MGRLTPALSFMHDRLKTLAEKRSRPSAQDRVLAAAYRCFDEFGPVKTTIEDIAKEADVTRRTVYKYFPNKEEILATIYRLEGQKLDAKVLRIAERGGDIAEALTDSIEVSLRTVLKTPHLRGVVASQNLTSQAAATSSALHQEHRVRWRPLLEPAMASGKLDPRLSLDEVVSWLILSEHILLLRTQGFKEPSAELRRFIRNFIVEPLLAERSRDLAPADRAQDSDQPSPLPAPMLSELEERILQAASSCFLTSGVKKTTLGDVAVAAEVSRRTLYRYFADKNDILEQLVIWHSSAVNREIRVRIGRHLPFEDIVTECLVLAVRIVSERPYLKSFSDDPAVAGRPADPSAPVYRVIRGQWASLFDAAAARGKLAAHLSVDEVVSWLYLAQSLLHTKVDAVSMDDEALRAFISRFIVKPLIA